MHLVKINGARGETETFPWLPNATHSVLVINEGSEIRNIEGAIASPDPPPVAAEEGEEAAQIGGEGTLCEVVTGKLSGTNLGKEEVPASEILEYGVPPPWSLGSLKAVPICFAMEVT